MRLLIILTFACIVTQLHAMQFGRNPCPISMGMGNSSTCIFSPYLGGNPALVALESKANVQTHCQNKGFLPQLGTYNIGMIYPFTWMNMGFGGSFHGFEAYHEFSLKWNVAKFFKPYVAFAIETEYTCLYASPKHEYTHSGVVSLGMLVFPIAKMRVGFSIYNLSFSPFTIQENQLRLPVIFKLGLAYHIAKKVLLTAEAQKSLDQPFAFCVGLDYQIIRAIAIRAGLFACQELTPSMGIGLLYKNFRFDMSMQYHFSMGCILAAGLMYQW